MSPSAETACEFTRRPQAVREGEMNDHYGECRNTSFFQKSTLAEFTRNRKTGTW